MESERTRYRPAMTYMVIAIIYIAGLSRFVAGGDVQLGAETSKLSDRQRLAFEVAKVDSKSLRSSLLSSVLKDDPESALARWYTANVSYHGEWLTIDEAQQQAVADANLTAYRQLRDGLANSVEGTDTVAGHEKLARWCQRKQLKELARVHWLHVLRFDSQHRAALNALDLQWHDGLLFTRDEVKRYQLRSREYREQTKRWKPKAKRWRRAIEQGELAERRVAREELQQVNDPAVAEALLEVFTEQVASDENAEKLRFELVGVLGQISSLSANEALVDFAVSSPWDSVRYAAIEGLKKKKLEEYVPLLLSAMRLPVDVSVSINQIGNRVINNYSYSQEGPGEYEHEYQSRSYRRITAQRYFVLPLYSYRTEKVRDAYVIPEHTRPGFDCNGHFVPPVTTPARHVPASYQTIAQRTGTFNADLPGYQAQQQAVARRSQSDATVAQSRVVQMNQQIERRNEQIADVLTQVTDETLAAFPKSWWNWWRDYVERHPEIDQAVGQQQFNQALLNRQPRGLARGTWIWTLEGRRHVEDIRVGDFVLAQNPESGELAYKSVVAIAQPTEQSVSRLDFPTGSLTCTFGHVFWHGGFGWQTVQNLRVGQRLHGVSEGSKIGHVVESYAIDTYDLIVDDFHTYFVGESGVLSHDGTPVGPSYVALPGFSAAAVAQAAETVLADRE